MRNGAYLVSLIFILIIPWEGVLQIPGLGTGTQTLGFLLAIFWLVSVFFTNTFRKPQPFHFLVLLFVLWNAISIFWSADPNRSVEQAVTWTLLLGLTFIIWDLYITQANLVAGLQVYIFGTFVAIGSAIYNFLFGNPYYTNYQRFSAGGTNPDGFGFIIALGVPIAWYLATSKNTTRSSGLLKLVNYAYIPAALMGLALSGTRTAMIATIPGMIFGLISLARIRIGVRITILLFLSVVILMLLPVIQPLKSFERLGTTTDALAQGNLNERTIIWREGLETFVEHPIFGVGSNMFRSVNSLGKVAHNTFISVLVELGLIGLAMFVVILTITVIEAWSLPKWEKSFWFCLLLVWAIGASSLTWEYRKTTWLFFNMIIASAALTRTREEKLTTHLLTPGVPEVANVPGVVVSGVNNSVATEISDGQELKRIDRIDSFCPNQACPDAGKRQTEQQKNIIRNGKSKTGRQRFKCKTCRRSFM